VSSLSSQPWLRAFFSIGLFVGTSATKGHLTMWAQNSALIGSQCEFANAPVNSITDPVLPHYLRSGWHCAIGDANPGFGKGENCGKCYRLTSLSNTGTGGTPGKKSSAVVMVSNGGAGGPAHFDCIMESFKDITGASTGIFDVEFEEVMCENMAGGPVVINWADKNAYYCKMMFENIAGWGSLKSVKACLGSNCKQLSRFAGATWTGCPGGSSSSGISFELMQESPSGQQSKITCMCSGLWPWATGKRCTCPTNFAGSGNTPSTPSTPSSPSSPSRPSVKCSASAANCQATKCCADTSLTCYVKDQYWASCKKSCTPGIDPNDDPKYQLPWTCDVLGVAAIAQSSGGNPADPGGSTAVIIVIVLLLLCCLLALGGTLWWSCTRTEVWAKFTEFHDEEIPPGGAATGSGEASDTTKTTVARQGAAPATKRQKEPDWRGADKSSRRMNAPQKPGKLKGQWQLDIDA